VRRRLTNGPSNTSSMDKTLHSPAWGKVRTQFDLRVIDEVTTSVSKFIVEGAEI